MNWAKERDLLIAQTMTFVQSVTGKKLDAEARTETRIEFASLNEIEKVERPIQIVERPIQIVQAARSRRRLERALARKFRTGWQLSVPTSSCLIASAMRISTRS